MQLVSCFVGIPMCYTFPRIILVTRDLGRMLEDAGGCLMMVQESTSTG
jgi:hypothetical protein